MPCYAMPMCLALHLMPRHTTPCPAMPYPVPYLVPYSVPYPVLPCPTLPRPAMPCHAAPCCPCPATPCPEQGPCAFCPPSPAHTSPLHTSPPLPCSSSSTKSLPATLSEAFQQLATSPTPRSGGATATTSASPRTASPLGLPHAHAHTRHVASSCSPIPVPRYSRQLSSGENSHEPDFLEQLVQDRYEGVGREGEGVKGRGVVE